uniref:Uncharacterized protein n=1 Tax=Acrobeloides nanus TaxID=290746 RepID=A0A914DD62_9BILA
MPVNFVMPKDSIPYQRTDFNITYMRYSHLMLRNIYTLSEKLREKIKRRNQCALFFGPVLKEVGLLGKKYVENFRNGQKNTIRRFGDWMDRILGDDRNRFSLRGFQKLKQTAVDEAIEKKSEVLKEEALIWSLLYVNLSHLFEEAEPLTKVVPSEKIVELKTSSKEAEKAKKYHR